MIFQPQFVLSILFIVSKLQRSQSRESNHTQPNVKQICISGETGNPAELNGVYLYYSYNTAIKGPRYYNWKTGFYLYPLILTNGYYWVIGLDYTGTNRVAALAPITTHSSPNYTFSIIDVFRDWAVYMNKTWTYHPSMLAVDCTTICVNNSYDSRLNGQYIWQYFSTAHISSIYHCASCNVTNGIYLYGSSNKNQSYFIFNSNVTMITSTTSANFSYCIINNISIYIHYFSQLYECIGKWEIYNGSHTISDPLVTKQCHPEAHTPSTTFNDQFSVCIEGETMSYTNLNGKYTFAYYNDIQHGAIYYNNINNLYMYPVTFNGRYIFIANNTEDELEDLVAYTPIIYSESRDSIYDIDAVFYWWKVLRLSNGTTFEYDSNMIAFECSTICVSGHKDHTMDGRYIYASWNKSTRSPNYFCDTCNDGDSSWLYARDWNHSYWILGATLYGTSDIMSRCLVNSVYNLACDQQWHTYNGTHFVVDTGLLTFNCDPTIAPTSHPSVEPTFYPTFEPTFEPTQHPSKYPTFEPTENPFKSTVIVSIFTSEAQDSDVPFWKEFIMNYWIFCAIGGAALCLIGCTLCCVHSRRRERVRDKVQSKGHQLEIVDNENVINVMGVNSNKKQDDVQHKIRAELAQLMKTRNPDIPCIELVEGPVFDVDNLAHTRCEGEQCILEDDNNNESNFVMEPETDDEEIASQVVTKGQSNDDILYNMNSDYDEEVRSSDNEEETPFGTCAK